MRSLGGAAVLMGLWLLMSGVYKPMVIGFGAASVVLVLVIVRRMDRVDGDRLDASIDPLKAVGYFAWLLVEIAKCNWTVTKVILSPGLPTRQHMFVVPYTQRSDLGAGCFLKLDHTHPGTISVETEQGHFLVHALSYGPRDDVELADRWIAGSAALKVRRHDDVCRGGSCSVCCDGSGADPALSGPDAL